MHVLTSRLCIWFQADCAFVSHVFVVHDFIALLYTDSLCHCWQPCLLAVAVAATSEVCAARTRHCWYMLIFGACKVDFAFVRHHWRSKQALWRTSAWLNCSEATPIWAMSHDLAQDT